jgi:hypothetical protein
MYAGVYLGGPRWSDMDVENARVRVVQENNWVETVAAPSVEAPLVAPSGSYEVIRREIEPTPPAYMIPYVLSEGDVAELKVRYEKDDNEDDQISLGLIDTEMDLKIKSL